MQKEEIEFLGQIVLVLEESNIKLRNAYEQKDYESLERLKRFILEIKSKIDEAIK